MSNEFGGEADNVVQAGTIHGGVNFSSTRKSFVELYQKAVDRLASKRPQVRASSLRTLAELGQDHPAKRQLVVDELCGYLRLPLSSKEGEAEVRRTALALLSERLKPRRDESGEPTSDTFWPEVALHLSRAILPEAAFDGCEFLPGTTFEGTTFLDEATFAGARFDATANFSIALFRSTVSFTDVRFADGALFTSTRFRNRADFSRARFAGTATFDYAEFEASAHFTGTTFGEAGFRWVTFGSWVDFTGAHADNVPDFQAVRDQPSMEEDIKNMPRGTWPKRKS